ncbi:TRASH domain-containing protein [Candidatus Micrarchaeota archaeon]|nr:TRASH domain-containing protein [Candidatus Micrarchaeota archaeon]
MICSFCGKEIPPGKGLMYVRRDGKIYYFCSSKCKRNMLNLKRSGKKTKWTEYVQKKRKEAKAKKK